MKIKYNLNLSSFLSHKIELFSICYQINQRNQHNLPNLFIPLLLLLSLKLLKNYPLLSLIMTHFIGFSNIIYILVLLFLLIICIIEENFKKTTKLYLFAIVFLWYLAYILNINLKRLESIILSLTHRIPPELRS